MHKFTEIKKINEICLTRMSKNSILVKMSKSLNNRKKVHKNFISIIVSFFIDIRNFIFNLFNISYKKELISIYY